jgi:hypothetical protein
MGRPSEYTPEIADAICERLAAGESLLSICTGDEYPAESTVRGWALDDREGFAAKYARAREMQADRHAEQIVDIADTEEDPQKARNRMDARKWFAAKVAPKKYGERTTLEHTDPAGNNPFASLMEAVAANGRPRPQAGD